MLEAYCKPFMAYYICHELWIYPKFMLPSLGFMKCMVNICHNTFWSCMNYRLGVVNQRSGGHGGKFNVTWEMGVSIPKIGLSWRYESFSFSLGELCSTLWYLSWLDVSSSAAVGRYVLHSSFATLI